MTQKKIEPKVLQVLTAQITQAGLIYPDIKDNLLRSKFLASYFFGFAWTIAYQFNTDAAFIKAFVARCFQDFYGGHSGLLIEEVVNDSKGGDEETNKAIDLGVDDAREYLQSLFDDKPKQPNGLVRHIHEKRAKLGH